jgi:glutamate---cysteine ligase / carboxylate-amine ligase
VTGAAGLPAWARWNADPGRPAWTIGLEEEVMLLDTEDWTLAHRIDDLLPKLSPELAAHVAAETHACTLELFTGVHRTVAEACAQLLALRRELAEQLSPLGLRAAVAGTHPMAASEETQVSGGARYQVLERGLRDLARREPTFALHVHVGVPLPELAIAAFDRIRAHLPLFLALSANSPFWRGRDSGMASFRTPLFQAFPRAGIPRRFGSYEDYVESIDTLLRADAFPEPTFIWWDVRLQPRLGTLEVRVTDAQTTVGEVAALAAFIQSLVRLEATEPLAHDLLLDAPEVLAENRFLASRDGVSARLIDPVHEVRVPIEHSLAELLERARSHARDLGCRAELATVGELARLPGAERQRALASERGLPAMVAELSSLFLEVPGEAAPEPTGLLDVERR